MPETKPLAIDLFCGLGGWTEAFLAEGYNVIGFDIERHVYGEQKYPAQLVLQDVLTLHGKQFRSANVIVASPPCQFWSRMAMPFRCPWTPEETDRRAVHSKALFDACFRIAKEAGVPLIVENVRGAEKYVGRARYKYGNFYLWGDVPALMPSAKHMKNGTGGSWFPISNGKDNGQMYGNNPARGKGIDGVKRPGMNWNKADKAKGFNVTAAQRYREEGQKCGGDWFNGYKPGMQGPRNHSSRSDSRKAASAQIAKIPFPLAQHIARVFKPPCRQVQPDLQTIVE